MIKMDTWITQLRVRMEKLRLGKITDAALSGRSTWHLPQITLDSVLWPWGLINGPLNTWRQAKSETKTERPHMSLQWAPKVATRCWAYHPRVDLH